MKFIIIVAALVAFAVGEVIQKVHPKDLQFPFGGRIVGGNPAATNQFPHQVSITADNVSFCGGSVIHHSWVLTAAHCIDGKSTLFLGFGHNNLDNPSIIMISKNFITHPNYNPKTLENDIALISLPTSLDLDDASIQAIRLPRKSQSTETFVGKKATVSGWGFTSDENSWLSQILNFVDVKIISNSECEDVYGTNSIQPSAVCAIGWLQDSDNTCTGDTGSALIIDESGTWTQIGVVSFVTTRGCSSGDPSGYARTASFLDWISLHTGINVRP